MYFKQILVMVIFCFGIKSFAQSQTLTLTGKVLNERNETLQGVSIKINETSGGTTTDIEGRYRLALKQGVKHTLTISAVGYATKTITDVEVGAGQENELNNELNIVLLVSVQDLGGVTVRASSRRQESTAALLNLQKIILHFPVD